ncbi:MAG: hypothetical protein HY079_15155 [Elusimicrobia bacterium]|nr:hypothetical protein [Elusimicrobiota bacterium]
MKLSPRFKAVLLGLTAAIYASGAAVWVLARWFQADAGYGLEPSPWKVPVLHAHSVAGLAFLPIVGYLWKTHIEPVLAQRKKRRSGWVLVGSFGAVIATVPFLFYATDAGTRSAAAAIHTWLGALVLAPLVLHLRPRR